MTAKVTDEGSSTDDHANTEASRELAPSNSKSEDTPLRHEEICPDYKFGRHYDNRNLVGGFICGCKDDCPNHLQDSPLGQGTSLDESNLRIEVMNDKQLREAAQKTVDYLYKIEGDCPPELYKSIATLRQLINEEFKPEKQLSSQFIFDIISPAFHTYGNRERLDELKSMEAKLSPGYQYEYWDEYFEERITELNREVES